MTIPKLKLAVPETRILVLSSFAESDRVFQAIKAGAMGYMLKDFDPCATAAGRSGDRLRRGAAAAFHGDEDLPRIRQTRPRARR